METEATKLRLESIPASAGIGLRAPHQSAFVHGSPEVAWLEVHSENYFAASGPSHQALMKIRERYPLSLHGVGLSLGSTDPLDAEHLRKLRDAIGRYEPGLVSEHLSWASVGGRHANDLLPLPYTREALDHMVERVDATQAYLGRRILIENVSSYLRYADFELTEFEFFTELTRRTGCGILLDINNLYVNERNLGTPASDFLAGIPAGSVEEIHLAGHREQVYDGHAIAVDTHDEFVAPEVWALYADAVRRFGRVPTLLEWDSGLPALEVLIGEARKAARIMDGCNVAAA